MNAVNAAANAALLAVPAAVYVAASAPAKPDQVDRVKPAATEAVRYKTEEPAETPPAPCKPNRKYWLTGSGEKWAYRTSSLETFPCHGRDCQDALAEAQSWCRQ